MEEGVPLNALLSKVAEYHPLYGGGLATHLPMVLIALSQLKAPNEKLVQTFNNSVEGLELIGSLDNIVALENIESKLGQTESYKHYLKHYQNALASNSVRQVLEASLPHLISGIAASAFHGLIRLAYAIEANNKSEIAIALAFWSIEYQPFELSENTIDENLEEILARLSPLGENHHFSPGIIVDRMDEIGVLLKSNNSLIQPKKIDLISLRKFVLTAFYACDDFTLLHTVTGCHAFSIIQPFLDNVDAGLRELWKAILVAYLSTGQKYKSAPAKVNHQNEDFKQIIKKALTTEDAHIIKLVYTCFVEYQKCKNPLYFLVAHRATD